MDWIHLAQNRDQALVNMLMTLHVPLDKENFLASQATVSFLRRNPFHVVSP